jgi:hypothetical protein
MTNAYLRRKRKYPVPERFDDILGLTEHNFKSNRKIRQFHIAKHAEFFED